MRGLIMNRSILAFACIFSVFLVAVISLSCSNKSHTTQAQENVGGPASLHVPLRPQIADKLCWAACTEMVSMYYDSITHGVAPVISQCMEAEITLDSNPKYNCDTINASNIPNYGANPFDRYHTDTTCFGYKATLYFCHDCSAMQWDTLCQYIRNKTPVCFGWSYQGITIKAIDSNGAHFMVAEGVPRSSYISHGWISVQDPWPKGKGLHRVMAYSEFANQFPPSIASSNTCVFSAHYGDYYVSYYPGQPQQ